MVWICALFSIPTAAATVCDESRTDGATEQEHAITLAKKRFAKRAKCGSQCGDEAQFCRSSDDFGVF
ncbi:hypothetical protein [Dictyobacter formicarum]|uniref:hypothetical protein n=1 Tax=Dictyobacter formicarum TaxID=2778368 RepID=UPI0019162809|nr:hypothetical protein [Dictyobacter formicarum]